MRSRRVIFGIILLFMVTIVVYKNLFTASDRAVVTRFLECEGDRDSPLPAALNYAPQEIPSNIVNHFEQKVTSQKIPVDDQGYKTIVFYTMDTDNPFILPQYGWDTDGTFSFPDSKYKCPKKCKATMDRAFAVNAHAVVFSVTDAVYIPSEIRHPPLHTRRADQIWVATTVESSLCYNANELGDLVQLFNWTFTYRLDSDVYMPFGYFYKRMRPRSLEDITLPTTLELKKKKLAVALVSNCGALSLRDLLIFSISKFIKLDQFGRCSKPCPDKDCRQYVASRYKFFLAFENSLCQDYITEKFFDSLAVGMVPVTFGFGDYDEVAPPGSYINALDFPNVTALTNYLTYLDRHDDEYLKYFEWKQYYTLGPADFAVHVCSLCTKLWDVPSNYTQQITNFQDWWEHKRKFEFEELEKTYSQNVTIGRKILRDSSNACMSPSNTLIMFLRGFLK